MHIIEARISTSNCKLFLYREPVYIRFAILFFVLSTESPDWPQPCQSTIILLYYAICQLLYGTVQEQFLTFPGPTNIFNT